MTTVSRQGNDYQIADQHGQWSGRQANRLSILDACRYPPHMNTNLHGARGSTYLKVRKMLLNARLQLSRREAHCCDVVCAAFEIFSGSNHELPSGFQAVRHVHHWQRCVWVDETGVGLLEDGCLQVVPLLTVEARYLTRQQQYYQASKQYMWISLAQQQSEWKKRSRTDHVHLNSIVCSPTTRCS
jgi:hypothetical protein